MYAVELAKDQLSEITNEEAGMGGMVDLLYNNHIYSTYCTLAFLVFLGD